MSATADLLPIDGVIPRAWACPRCGRLFGVYEHLPFDSNRHACGLRFGEDVRTFWVYTVLTPTGRVHSVRLVNVIGDDPLLRLASRGPDGREHEWGRREEGGELAFYPPPGFESPHGFTLGYSKFQRHEALPRTEQERRALAGRHSG